MAIRLFIDGAAGTTGLEIRERLQGRDEFELLVLDDAQRKDESARRDALHAADIAILCLPDEAAKDALRLADGSDTRIIDASSAHRVAEGWTYGFPELIGHDKIANARLVSNPGCYPTGFLALVAGLTYDEIIPRDYPYTVNAVSGYSGGGNALIDRFAAEPDLAYRAYGLGMGHKHLAEMRTYAQLDHPPVFSPSVIPAFRGMIVDVPLDLVRLGLDDRPIDLAIWLNEWFERSPVINVNWPTQNPGELVIRQNAEPWDGMELYCLIDERGLQARLMAHLDNLGKGASGAAIQNLNIMCGLPETTGLRLG